MSNVKKESDDLSRSLAKAVSDLNIIKPNKDLKEQRIELKNAREREMHIAHFRFDATGCKDRALQRVTHAC